MMIIIALHTQQITNMPQLKPICQCTCNEIVKQQKCNKKKKRNNIWQQAVLCVHSWHDSQSNNSQWNEVTSGLFRYMGIHIVLTARVLDSLTVWLNGLLYNDDDRRRLHLLNCSICKNSIKCKRAEGENRDKKFHSSLNDFISLHFFCVLFLLLLFHLYL